MVEDYDGLCGIPCPIPLRVGTYLRCNFELGHGGDHSWKKHEHHIRIFGGVTFNDMGRHFYRVPDGCCCIPVRTTEGEIAEYIFSPDCKVHSK